MTTIWTIGYERLRPEMLADELEAAEIERVLADALRDRRPDLEVVDL